MRFNDLLRKRILAATAGVLSMAATAQAVEPRRSAEGWDEPIGAWSDPAHPLSAYGLQTFSLVPYRKEVDEVLSPDAQLAFEKMANDLQGKVSLKEGEIYEKTILLNAMYDVVTSSLSDHDFKGARESINSLIADYLREPDATLAKIIDQYADVTPTESDDNSAFDDAPPETQQGVKAYLEHANLQIKGYDLAIRQIDSLVSEALNLPVKPKKEQLEEIEAKLTVLLSEGPSLETSISAYIDVEYGSDLSRGIAI